MALATEGVNGRKFTPLLGKNWPNPKNYSNLQGFFNEEKFNPPTPKFLATPLLCWNFCLHPQSVVVCCVIRTYDSKKRHMSITTYDRSVSITKINPLYYRVTITKSTMKLLNSSPIEPPRQNLDINSHFLITKVLKDERGKKCM